MKKKLISIVIPVYNTTSSLCKIYELTQKIFEELRNYQYEIIFVDDNSPNPDTWKILVQLAKQNQKITAIKLSKNFGQQPATICGLKHANGDYIITMDDDLQHNPRDILKFLDKENDVIIAKFKEKKHSLIKRVTSSIKGYFDHIILGKPKEISLSSYRMIKREIVDKIINFETPFPFLPAQIFSISSDIINVKIEHHKRIEGKSEYTLKKRFNLFKNLLINNSSLLLNIIGKIGISISIISFIYAIYIIIRKLVWGITAQGWASLIVINLILGGLILFTTGIIGEYLIRIIKTIEKKPIYSIKEKI